MVNSRFNDPDQIRQKIRRVDQDNVDGDLFVEVLLTGLKLRNAAALAQQLQAAPAVLSRIRAGRAVSDEMLLKLHLVFGLSISGLKDLLTACTFSDVPVTIDRIDALASTAVFTERTDP